MRAARLATLGAATALTLAVTAAPASAHTALRSSNPAAKATVAAPSEILLTYTQTISMPKVVLTDAQGGRHETGAPRAVDNKVTQPVQGTLPNGEYTVGWRVVSADGHPVSGTFTFTVKGSTTAAAGSSAPASAAPAAPAPAPAPSQAAEKESSGSSGWLWIGLVVAVIALIAGGIAWARRPKQD
ncbi:copper resistance CopC family protein [Actinomadura hibisca]|uniref:copper resistance CopC family protein n=1 Tax=Actinomadura hibisca TaxID=68565 RepID=UPI0008304F08|nr:copper resistance protein CopC [Actinomadura hibisca]